MTLQYRGVRYQPNSPQITTSAEVIGHYRGSTAVRLVAQRFSQKRPEGLKYRGASVR